MPVQHIYRPRDIKGVSGYSPKRIAELSAEGKFPKAERLGEKAIGWPENVIEFWQQCRFMKAWDRFADLLRVLTLNALALTDTADDRKVLIEKLKEEINFLRTEPLRAEKKAAVAA